MRFVILVFSIAIIFSCNSNGEVSSVASKLPNIKRIYTEGRGHEIDGYNHFVTLDNYDINEKMSNNFFVDYADAYKDTCTQQLPVWEVTFCTPFNFTPTYDSQDLEPLFQHAIVSIGYTEETLFKKYPDIGSITFYKDGKSTYVQTMTLARMKYNGYLDSNRQWLKEFDKKFKTHYSDSSKEVIQKKQVKNSTK